MPSDIQPGAPVQDLRLSSSKDVEIVVLGMDGQPVAGAIVTERAYFGDWPLLGDDERVARQFEFLPRVSAVTDSSGVASLPVLPSKAWIQATADTRCSSTWTGIGAHHISLRLVASCEIEGRVVDESGAGVPPQGAVSCQVRRGFEGTFITLAPIKSGGTFGPVRLPLDSDDGFILQYFGGELEAAQLTLAAPKQNSSTTVEIRTRPGLGVPLVVTDEQDHPLANVATTIQWTRNGEWRRVDRRTNADGRARLANLPTGEVWVKLRKSGYVPELRKLDFAEDWVRHPLEVKMGRAATVEGVCTSDGLPQKNFSVTFWKKEPTDGGTVQVEDSDDGSFKIEEAAPGLVQLFASSSEVVQTVPVSLTVEAGAVGKTQLTFTKPRTVTARVVEASSGDPIPTAKVTIMLIVGQRTLRPWKAAQPVDANGMFEARGLGGAQGYLSIAADGFATRGLSVWAGEQQPTDMGQIALHRSQSLMVRLHSSTSVDFSSYGVTLTSATKYLPGVAVPADGLLRFDNLAPGLVHIRLEASTGSTIQRTVRIRPAGNSTCEFDLDGDPLSVVVVPPNGSPLPNVVDLGIRYTDPQGEQLSQWVQLPDSGEVTVGGIRASRVLLELQSEGGTRLATGDFELPATAPRKITFNMSAKPARLRLVDQAHRPIPGAALSLTNRTGVADSRYAFTTDENGEVLVPDVGSGAPSVSVVHTEFGVLPCVQVALAEAHGSVLQITMPPAKDVQVELRDGQTALAAVEIELQDSCGSTMSLGRMLADANGIVRLQHLGPGDYRILVDHPGIWRTEQPITVTPTSTNFIVQLRRLGSARIRAKTGVGNAIEGVGVELVDVATGVRVADWIEKGEVPAPANGLRTDASGALVIHGLPRGSYRCVLTSPTGGTLERTLEVPAQALGELEAVVP